MVRRPARICDETVRGCQGRAWSGTDPTSFAEIHCRSEIVGNHRAYFQIDGSGVDPGRANTGWKTEPAARTVPELPPGSGRDRALARISRSGHSAPVSVGGNSDSPVRQRGTCAARPLSERRPVDPLCSQGAGSSGDFGRSIRRKDHCETYSGLGLRLACRMAQGLNAATGKRVPNSVSDPATVRLTLRGTVPANRIRARRERTGNTRMGKAPPNILLIMADQLAPAVHRDL